MLNKIFSQSIEVVTTVNRYKPVLVIALLVVLLLLSTATVFTGLNERFMYTLLRDIYGIKG